MCQHRQRLTWKMIHHRMLLYLTLMISSKSLLTYRRNYSYREIKLEVMIIIKIILIALLNLLWRSKNHLNNRMSYKCSHQRNRDRINSHHQMKCSSKIYPTIDLMKKYILRKVEMILNLIIITIINKISIIIIIINSIVIKMIMKTLYSLSSTNTVLYVI